MNELATVVIGSVIVAGAFWLWVRFESHRTTNRMWKEALENPRKMEYIRRFIERGGPPPGI